ncbi:CGP-CTERM-anchored Cys-rich protein [Thermococcus aciditolerans]|uniref:Eight-cysteine-cluster domain-containing protein n=1 Tax=Thermococcus aciditolerans TaxID=2598455 RepID=A0A5C0SN36_9EURY|nr:CGP-CTERM-anchored Cys-rich protein [Thermococcus aciditolerans]QEK15166.1 eight-cysteine-cluster domain-containing protein [Thermococcus aciditolerans]
MKRLAALIVLIMFTLTPIVKACMSPADTYAVEVVLNKPGITYRPYPAFNALHNAIVKNGTFIFRSHYDRRLYVRLWNESDGPHLRVQIPVEWKTIDVSRASLNLSILITEETLEKLRADGWNVTDNTTFERNGVRISLTPVTGKECTSDADCATGGCSGEVCAPKKEAREIVTPCVYKPWYDCLSLTSCGCVRYFELEVEGVNRSDDEVNAAVKDFLSAFGISCDVPLTLVKTSVTRLSPSLDPSEVNASKALKAELEWLIETGALRMDESDVEGVLRAAEWGNAGHNSHIGWYETGNGTFAWIPYDESLNPLLVRCFTREVPVYELPNGTAYVGPTLTKPPSGDSTTTSGSTKGEVCGPGIVVLLALIAALAGRR